MDVSNKNAANLDILRAIAVTLVVVDHCLEMISRQGGISLQPFNWMLGRFGVLLFFVHTSLVLNRSMYRLNCTGLALVRTFLIRRAFRIYPLAILCVLTVVSFQIPRMPWYQFEWKGIPNLISNIALTTNLTFSDEVLNPLWSLPVEVQMYVALPFIFLLIGPKKNPMIVLILWIAAVIAAVMQPRISGRLSVLFFAPCFMGGVLAYSLSGRIDVRIAGRWWMPYLLTMIAIYLLIQVSFESVHLEWPQWLMCLVIGATIPAFEDSLSKRINIIAASIAKYSYGIYLFHCIALWVGYSLLDQYPPWAQWSAMAGILAASSVLCYHWLEKPAIALGVALTSSPAAEPIKTADVYQH